MADGACRGCCRGSRLRQASVRCMEHSARDECTKRLPSGELADDSRASWCVGEEQLCGARRATVMYGVSARDRSYR